MNQLARQPLDINRFFYFKLFAWFSTKLLCACVWVSVCAYIFHVYMILLFNIHGISTKLAVYQKQLYIFIHIYTAAERAANMPSRIHSENQIPGTKNVAAKPFFTLGLRSFFTVPFFRQHFFLWILNNLTILIFNVCSNGIHTATKEWPTKKI